MHVTNPCSVFPPEVRTASFSSAYLPLPAEKGSGTRNIFTSYPIPIKLSHTVIKDRGSLKVRFVLLSSNSEQRIINKLFSLAKSAHLKTSTNCVHLYARYSLTFYVTIIQRVTFVVQILMKVKFFLILIDRLGILKFYLTLIRLCCLA